MQILDDGTVVFSASDLTAAAACEWALMRSLDFKLGRDVTIPGIEDPMLKRAGELGDVHERAILADLENVLGTAVTIDRPTYGGSAEETWREKMDRATGETTDALKKGSPLVFQGAFFDGEFQGFSDFLVLNDENVYEVYDTKLARHAKIPALLQLAAYVDQLRKIGIPTSDTVRLILGDREESVHDVADILPVYLHRRARLRELIDGRLADVAATPWNDPRYTACGRCAVCAPEVETHRDVLLVAGISLTQRAKLRDAGVDTIESLAATSKTVDGIPRRTLEKLQAQAQIQLGTTGAIPAYTVFDPMTLAAIPAPDSGDLFFDFEGDPLYEEKNRWGLDYLFGVLETKKNETSKDDPQFRTFWAETLAEEKLALEQFMSFVRDRRRQHPDMHIYHYASYEKTHLLSLAARHGVCEDEVDDLLRQNVLVDLYPIVRRSVRVGSHSYSIKKLEPLYMGSEHREGTANAADSVQQFADYSDARDNGQLDVAATLRTDIVQYNRYDCLSTLRLRDWLAGLAAQHGVGPIVQDLPELVPIEPSPVYLQLAALIEGVAVETRTPLESAISLAAAAIDYHRREDKRFWQEHFSRLSEPDESVWADTRGVMTMDVNQVTVIRDWSKPTSKSGFSRDLLVTGSVAAGSSFRTGDSPYLVYDEPYPPVLASPPRTDVSMRLAHSRTALVAIGDDLSLLVRENLGKDADEHDLLPMALTPPSPFNVSGQKSAILEWGQKVLDCYRAADGSLNTEAVLDDAAFDILLRSAPRGAGLAPVSESTADAIVSTLLGLESSYVAVQGPPGSGKTFTGSHVIARLVTELGWKVGVVAQSHMTVQNVLEAVIDRGVPKERVGKRRNAKDAVTDDADDDRPWTMLSDARAAEFIRSEGGAVYGGTAWDFTNENRVPRDAFDLLVIDEAGQYSLANTIAVSAAAKRLLLLGDPQQLPQVTVGSHPEPIDTSALGWLSLGHDVLPEQLGYFLPTSWRMDAALCEPVSRLSYAGKLHAASGPDAPMRHLEGIDPGLYSVPIEHVGNATESAEEAAEVVRIVAYLLGRAWTESRGKDGATTAPLAEDDIIVVAAYNAQVSLLRDHLDAAGHPDVRVGTVDKFQGREASVSIVSLAASSAAEVPRGIEFLLMPNRLNVAISRAKWASYLVHSPALADHLPTNAASLALLGKFLRLADGALRRN